ncbi:unnamed protein product [Withania somnifera]
MATLSESAKKLFIPDSYPFVNLLNHLHSDDDNLLHKLFETIQRSLPSSVTCIRCYDLLRDVLPSLWTNFLLTTQNEMKINLNYKVWVEEDYETLKACSSCVSSLAGLLFVKHEWDTLFYFMFKYLRSNAWNRKLGALFLWNELIPKCPEVFLPYVDGLIEGFKDLMPTVSDDHRCGVVAAKASVKLILYLSTPASYCKFYGLLGHVVMTMFVALGDEEELVCSLLEDLIVLAGVETAFFEAQIGVTFESMVRLAENLGLEEKTRQLAIEFVVTVAADRENGCGMMQMVPKEVFTRLLCLLIVMLVHIEDDPSWENATSDDKNEGELSINCIRGDVIVPSCPASCFNFLHDQAWRIRHAAVTAIGLISEGCSKALLLEMDKLVETIVNLIHDGHPRVRWATIHSIGQLSKHLSPRFQEQYHQQLLPALIQVLDDFDYPRVQTQATSAIMLFSHNCSSDVLKLYLHKIVNKLVVFLQRGMDMMKEAALATLATLAISSKEDSLNIYDSVMAYLKVILVTANKDTSHTLLVKTLECSTMITMSVGNLVILDHLEKVTAALISLQETQMEVEDPIRSLLLQAWGRLCKHLGADFLPYLSIAMPIVLKSVRLMNYLSVSNNSDTDDSDDESMNKVTVGVSKMGIRSTLLEEKALACHMLCCFAAELKGGLHLWVKEVVSTLVPLLTFKFSEGVRTASISAMPLLLQSVASATTKGLPVTGCSKPPLQKLFDTIIPALLDALKKESKIQIQARLLGALNECIQIPGPHLSKQQTANFVDGLSKVLSTCSYHKIKREERASKHNNQREQELVKEEAEHYLTICRDIDTCLGTMVEKLKASFLPHFDKFLPFASLMWSKDRIAEERRIVMHIFRNVAEQCREEAVRYYEEWIPRLLKIYDHKNPDVQQLVATAIGICAEFGGDFLKPHTAVIFNYFKFLMEHPDAKLPDNITAYEAAVSACGKLCQFVSEGIYTYEFIYLWLYNLPIRCNLDEAKISHEQLCSMIEMSENKVIGPQGIYIPQIIAIFAEVLWSGNNLATQETTKRMIKLLNKFQRELQPSVFSDICATLTLPQQNMLRAVFSS